MPGGKKKGGSRNTCGRARNKEEGPGMTCEGPRPGLPEQAVDFESCRYGVSPSPVVHYPSMRSLAKSFTSLTSSSLRWES